MPITVLLVDDHSLLREAIREFLSLESDLQLVAQAANGSQALSLTAEFQPQVVILDIGLPDINGLEVAQRLTQTHPASKIIVVSAQLDPTTPQKARRAGALSIIRKDQIFEELPKAIRLVAQGRQYVPSGLTD